MGEITDEDIEKEVHVIVQMCTIGHGNIIQILQHDWFKSGSIYFVDMELCSMIIFTVHENTKDLQRHSPMILALSMRTLRHK